VRRRTVLLSTLVAVALSTTTASAVPMPPVAGVGGVATIDRIGGFVDGGGGDNWVRLLDWELAGRFDLRHLGEPWRGDIALSEDITLTWTDEDVEPDLVEATGDVTLTSDRRDCRGTYAVTVVEGHRSHGWLTATCDDGTTLDARFRDRSSTLDEQGHLVHLERTIRGLLVG
jgi:hypothetical protein